MFKNKEWEFPVGSIVVAELDDDEKAALGLTVAETDEDDVEDLSKLYKSELVERAQALGYDTDGLLKEQIIELLESGTPPAVSEEGEG